MDLSSFLSLNPKRPKPICNNSNEGKEPVPSAPVNHQEDLSDEDYGTPIPATSDSVVGYSASILVGYLGEAYFQMLFFFLPMFMFFNFQLPYHLTYMDLNGVCTQYQISTLYIYIYYIIHIYIHTMYGLKDV